MEAILGTCEKYFQERKIDPFRDLIARLPALTVKDEM